MSTLHRQLLTFGATTKTERLQHLELSVGRSFFVFVLSSLGASALGGLWEVDLGGSLFSPGALMLALIWSGCLLYGYRRLA